MYNVESTIGSQYANSPSIDALIESMQSWIDPTVNLQQFYNLVWNISTAVGFGLDIWGSILGISRNLSIPGAICTYFGFNGGAGVPFNNAPFYAGASNTTTYTLPDPQYLTLLLAKAYANISVVSIPDMNAMLQMLFGAGSAYVIDQGGMILTLVFNFTPTPVQYAIISTSGVLPHPTGVLVDIRTPTDNVVLSETGSDVLAENGLEVLAG